MMFALGCIQAQICNSNACPTGVATQDPKLVRGLVVANKSKRVHNYQRETVHTLLEVVAAAGLSHPSKLRPEHIMRRVSARQVLTFADIYPESEPGSFLRDDVPSVWRAAWQRASADRFC